MELTKRQKRFIVAAFLVTDSGTGSFTETNVASRLGWTEQEAGNLLQTFFDLSPALLIASYGKCDLTPLGREMARELIDDGWGEGL